jgi:hypothetical protein
MGGRRTIHNQHPTASKYSGLSTSGNGSLVAVVKCRNMGIDGDDDVSRPTR